MLIDTRTNREEHATCSYSAEASTSTLLNKRSSESDSDSERKSPILSGLKRTKRTRRCADVVDFTTVIDVSSDSD